MIESEIIAENTEDHCLQLYLSLNQYNLATLKISRMNKRVDGNITQIYTTNRYEGDGWRMKQVDVPSVGYPSSLVIEGLVGNNMLNAGKKGQFAVDDVMLKMGKCEIIAPSTDFECQPGETVNIDLVCDFKKDCSNGADESNCGTCDFENELCGWEDKSVGSYKWIRVRNASISDNIGPAVDHTLNNQNGKPLDP